MVVGGGFGGRSPHQSARSIGRGWRSAARCGRCSPLAARRLSWKAGQDANGPRARGRTRGWGSLPAEGGGVGKAVMGHDGGSGGTTVGAGAVVMRGAGAGRSTSGDQSPPVEGGCVVTAVMGRGGGGGGTAVMGRDERRGGKAVMGRGGGSGGRAVKSPGMNPRADPTKPLRGWARAPGPVQVGSWGEVVVDGQPRRGAGAAPVIGDREPKRNLSGRASSPTQRAPARCAGEGSPGPQPGERHNQPDGV